MTTFMLWLLAVMLVLTGLAGAILPALPGIPMVFVGLAVAAWIDDFNKVGMWPMIVIGVLAALSLVIDALASVHGVRRAGASRQALVGAAIGTVVGMFFGLPGLLIGPFAGAALGQLVAGGTLIAAGQAGLGAWAGFVVGSVAKIAIGLLMIAIFVIAYVA
ncbi:MAG: DUF456 family protein [Betaproteobacteria bacterium]|nr:DUF456 family protein [Betaproteobacteria bacterium]